MITVAQAGFDPAEVSRLEMIYRLVGKRNAGIKFDACVVPMFIMTPLIGDFAEYLAEIEASQQERQEAVALFEKALGLAA